MAKLCKLSFMEGLNEAIVIKFLNDFCSAFTIWIAVFISFVADWDLARKQVSDNIIIDEKNINSFMTHLRSLVHNVTLQKLLSGKYSFCIKKPDRQVGSTIYGEVSKDFTDYRNKFKPMSAKTASNNYFVLIAR